MIEILVGLFAVIVLIILIWYKFFKLPSGIYSGDIVRCATDGRISKIEGNKKRWFPNVTVYAKYGSPPAKNVDCAVLATIADGENMS